ncbi:hypothetical protein WG66_014694 [Moniliophthora roreri]|nr:hypothetical protein WG66_014694 [Moniliophthora roreri]
MGGGGGDQRYLSEKGYGSLALPMHGQVFSLVVGDDGIGSPVVTTLFFLGLLANVFGAILNYQASCWFEMLTVDEVVFLECCREGSPDRDRHYVDRESQTPRSCLRRVVDI